MLSIARQIDLPRLSYFFKSLDFKVSVDEPYKTLDSIKALASLTFVSLLTRAFM